MRIVRHAFICLAALAPLSCKSAPRPDVPRGYPASYAEQIEAANQEGELDILSATDRRKAAGLIADFQRRYPRIKLRFVELSAQQVYDRVRSDSAEGHGTADLIWSSAMDLQMKLVNDGLTQRYVSPERRPHYPHWSNWKNQAWAVTAEPVVFVYNRALIPDSQVPRDHVQLRNFLECHPAPGRIRVATYSLGSSAVGYLYFSQDQQVSGGFWSLVRSFGQNGGLYFPNAEQIVGAIESGRAAIGYDIIGSYALDVVRHHPNLGMILPRDYSLVMSRIVVIPSAARHPHAAQLFLDRMLSREGQSELAAAGMPPVRDDVAEPDGLNLRGASLRAIRVGPGLLITQDLLTREHFLRKWATSIEVGAAATNLGPSSAGERTADRDRMATGSP